jgi:hypothetical protein
VVSGSEPPGRVPVLDYEVNITASRSLKPPEAVNERQLSWINASAVQSAIIALSGRKPA